MALTARNKMSGAFARITGRKPQAEASPSRDGFALVRRATNLQDIRRIETHLPEILGRALARGWIDGNFSTALMSDPKGLLASYNVFLPDNISIEVETTASQRQRIVVYENRANGEKRRVMYLQLVMMAGK